jgi:hypothetical protein
MTDTNQTADVRAAEPAGDHGLGRCLVVADRGHVWAARNVRLDEDFVRITEGRAVRRWGTSEGLNELANKGPLPNTRLDAAADLLVSRKALIAIIPCEVSKWPG